jgi:hypothetical protein
MERKQRKRGRPPTVVALHKRSMSFPVGLYTRLEEIALREERNVNELVVSVLRGFVREQGATKKEQEPGPKLPAPAAA